MAKVSGSSHPGPSPSYLDLDPGVSVVETFCVSHLFFNGSSKVV